MGVVKGFINIDFTELEEYVDKFHEVVENHDAQVKRILEKIAKEYLVDLAERTPVDTGRLQNQWILDNMNINVVDRGDLYEVELINTTKYASWVEKGHWSYNQFGGPYGWVIGRFYVRKTENLWKHGRLDERIQQEYETWLKKMLEGG